MQFDPEIVDVFVTTLMKTQLSNQFVLYGWKNCKEAIEGLLEELNIPGGSENYFEIRLILTEALSNAFKHGNRGYVDKPIYLRYTYNGKVINFEIEDSGKGFKNVPLPGMIQDESLLDDSGRGLFLVKSMADKIDFKGNTMIIRKNLISSKRNEESV